MIIEQHKVVALTYILKENNKDGELIETVNSEKPIEFIFGTGNLLAAFEDHINGLKNEDLFEFVLPKEDAYGIFKEELIVALKKEMFAQNGVINEEMLRVGNQIPMQDSQGNRLNGKITEMSDDQLTMDFNHPLAGQNLYFSGQVVMIREASNEELNPPAHQGCGCGSEEGSCSTEDNHTHQHSDDGCGCNDSGCGC